MGKKAKQLKQDNKKDPSTLEEGDLIEFPRGIYSHWGVYIGMYQCPLFNSRISMFLAFLFTFL